MNGETIKGSVNEFLPAKTLPVPSNGLTRNAKFPKSRSTMIPLLLHKLQLKHEIDIHF